MTLEELLVRIKVENKQAVRGLEEAKKAADQATGRFDGLRKKLTELGRTLGKKPKAEAAKELEKGLKDADRAIAQTERRLQSLQRTASKRTESSDFKNLQEEAKQAEKTIEELARRREKMNEAALAGKYGAPETQLYNEQKAVFDRLRSDENETRGYLKDIQTRMGEMIADGSAYVQSESAKAAGAQIRVEQANLERLKRFREELNANLEGAVSNPTLQRLQAFLNGVRKAGAGIKNFASKSVRALKGVVSWIGKMGRGFGTVLSKIPLLNRIPKTLNKIKRGMFMGSGMRSLIKLGAAGFLVYRAVQMMREGFKNLAQYSGQTNSDLSMLMGSLNTLKNALATAFAPILTAVAPALNHLIQLLVKAATAVAHFTAAFTGKSTVVVAKQQTADYASSLGDAADAAGSANDAAKEYQKTLLGFDQMNILNDADKSSGSGGAGGGYSGGAGVGDMFETVDVSNGAKSLADKIKESWEKADFTDLGKQLGNKIAGMLDKIPWESLKETAYKVGKSIATGFNGLNDSKFWASLGTSLGESVNTIISGIKGFVENFKWEDAGKAFATGVNKFFGTVDWKDIGSTVSKAVGGILDTITGFFTTVDWEQVGNDLVKVIKGVDWPGLIVKGIKAAGSIGSAVLNLLKGAFQSAIDGISDWITSGKIWEDLLNIGKVTLDIKLNLIGDAWDLIKTIVKGVDKFKVELGGAILEGIGKAVSWIAEKLGFTEKNTPKTPESNPVQYQGHDWQGVDMSKPLNVKLTGVLDKVDQSKLTEAQKTINGSKAKVTTQTDAIPAGKKLIGGMSAVLQSHKQGEKFGMSIGGMSAILQSHKQGKKFSHVIDKMKAKITSRDNALSDKEKTLHGFNAKISSRENALSDKEKVLGGFTAKLTAKLDAITGKTITGFTAEIADFKASRNSKGKVIALTKADGGLYRNGRWQPIAAAANGGAFNTGQMFIAREAGPELVGKIGGGTAVMNNDQIVSSVAKGVYDAVLSAMSMSGDNKSVNVYLQGDANKLFKVVQKEAIQFTNTTGQAPFPA